MRLIDADKLMEEIIKICKCQPYLEGMQSEIVYIQDVVDEQPTAFDVEKLKMKNMKEDVLRIEHSCLNTIESIATMDDTESFKTFGYMSGVNEMANEIIKFISEEIKAGGIDD